VVQAMSFSTPAFGRGGDQTGMAIIQLSDWAVRDETATEFGRSLSGRLAGIPDVMIRTFQPGFRGGSTAAVQFVLQGSDYGELNQQGLALKEAAAQSGLMQSPDLDYAEKTPELQVTIERERGHPARHSGLHHRKLPAGPARRRQPDHLCGQGRRV
jgi:HAE1 family hydrophobic/amphiphilic exporter-1